jgi:hypothetical protein
MHRHSHRHLERERQSAAHFNQLCERQDLSLRIGRRRFTLLTNAFSKKVEKHCFMVATYAYYNFPQCSTDVAMQARNGSWPYGSRLESGGISKTSGQQEK